MKRLISSAISLIILATLVLSLGSCMRDRVKSIDIKLTNEKYAYAVNKNDKELLSTVNTVLDRIKKDGTLNEIVEKYFSGNEDEYLKVSAGVESLTKKQLVVVTHIPFSPFEFAKYESGKGKQFSGIDIEIASLVAKEMGAELVIKEKPLGELLNEVAAGNADIAMAGLTVTSDREKLVSFSDTYYEASQTIIVRADDTTFDDCKTRADVEKVLSSMGSSVKVGCQKNSTSALYVKGDKSLGFAGYAITPVEYASAVHAAQALISEKVDLVIVDQCAGALIVKDINE